MYDDSLFPPYLWAHAPDGTASTTNCAENFHRNYNANFYHSHPNVFHVVQILIDIQIETQSKLNSIEQNMFYSKRNEQIAKDIYYSQLYNSMRNGVITRENYVQTMGNFFKGKKLEKN